ncbi:hypothetical protein NQ317_004807 [Molorchus minor]|uniref:ER-bound oxygenase mpaB/mpaB'/Rubber oxygenase catalytic domain-containing protein n=1 Tax=Molorchus minor TaxID=1323400 RepID=A0ABQ9JAK6_9CUCU|nr:hypothetical protein NQ317_004807 [Molorchus minor]
MKLQTILTANMSCRLFTTKPFFKKGQQFFHKHIFSIFFSDCLGLMVFAICPNNSTNIDFYKMSGNCMMAYRRYLATIFHMNVWYESDFKPGSRLWRSLAEIRNKHNSASKRSCISDLGEITQKDMALTQFGFMGFALVRSKMVGIHEASEEEWKAFLHVWRVVGYVLGIEDRFNLCNRSVKETRDICNLLIDQVYRPYVEKKDEDFISMCTYLVNGLWSMSPIINVKSLFCYLHIIVQNNVKNEKIQPTYMKLNFVQNLNFNVLLYSMYLLQYNWFRIYQNFTKVVSLWLMKVFPFLAYYQFGIANSHVYILDDKNK